MLPRNLPFDAPSRVGPIEIASSPDIVVRQATATISYEIRLCRSSADFARLRPAWDMFAASCSPGLDFTYCEVAAARSRGAGGRLRGMSRAQLVDRARRLALRVSLRVLPETGPDGVRLYPLVLEAGEVRTELVAHVRCFVRRRAVRRAKVSLPPMRDVRQQGLFS